MGAEVIKIEPVVSDEFTRSLPHLKNEVSGFFLHMNSGKKSISVDLKQPKGLAILKELAAVSDVIIQNHKSGFHERIGLPYEKLAGNNPPSRFQFDIQRDQEPAHHTVEADCHRQLDDSVIDEEASKTGKGFVIHSCFALHFVGVGENGPLLSVKFG